MLSMNDIPARQVKPAAQERVMADERFSQQLLSLSHTMSPEALNIVMSQLAIHEKCYLDSARELMNVMQNFYTKLIIDLKTLHNKGQKTTLKYYPSKFMEGIDSRSKSLVFNNYYQTKSDGIYAIAKYCVADLNSKGYSSTIDRKDNELKVKRHEFVYEPNEKPNIVDEIYTDEGYIAIKVDFRE